MNATAPATLTPPIKSAFLVKASQFRLIPRLETYPAVVSFAQTILGRALLLLLFGLGLRVLINEWLPIMLCLALITCMPQRRRALVAISTLVFTFTVTLSQWRFPFRVPAPLLLGVSFFALVLGLGALLFWCARRWPHSFFGRSPVACFLSGFSALILISSFVPPSSVKVHVLVWDFIAVLSIYVWFFCYSLTDRAASPRGDFPLELGTFQPFWGSTNTPYPKGAAYLRRIEAKNAEEFAVVQLKGLKLLAWALLISLVLPWWTVFFHQYLGIPPLQVALAMSVNRSPLVWYKCWSCLALSFFESIMTTAVFGHRVIACCRIAGFNALRNTYRPLSSVTVVEFFNRYYFYFKELLVDFFFYPTFFACFKSHRRLRLTAAIFAAACFGNAYYHFIRDWPFIEQFGIWPALVSYQTQLFYCVALAAGLSISQLRKRKHHADFLRGRVLPSISVALFFMLLDVFGSSQRNYPLVEHFRFFGHLFRIGA